MHYHGYIWNQSHRSNWIQLNIAFAGCTFPFLTPLEAGGGPPHHINCGSPKNAQRKSCHFFVTFPKYKNGVLETTFCSPQIKTPAFNRVNWIVLLSYCFPTWTLTRQKYKKSFSIGSYANSASSTFYIDHLIFLGLEIIYKIRRKRWFETGSVATQDNLTRQGRVIFCDLDILHVLHIFFDFKSNELILIIWSYIANLTSNMHFPLVLTWKSC